MGSCPGSIRVYWLLGEFSEVTSIVCPAAGEQVATHVSTNP